MAAEPHFVQRCEGPVFIGHGPGGLRCTCGNTLIEGYEPGRFLAVALACGQCASVTLTSGLAPGAHPPFAVVIAEPVAEARTYTMTLPAHAFVIGRAEMDRITVLFQPHTPESSDYRLTPDLLERAAAAYQACMGAVLPGVAAGEGFEASRQHPLGWAVAHLRSRMAGRAAWSCVDRAETSAAAVLVSGFLHFVATWSHHPLFPAMAATAGERGFSAHGLAPFAAAHCLTMMRNRVGFTSGAGRIQGFNLAVGPTDVLPVVTEVFDRFEHPFGQRWDPSRLADAVADRIGAVQARVNLRHPGILLLSPGTALRGFDEALITAVKQVLPAGGRKNRGLMAVGVLVLRMQAIPDPHALRFVYGLFPIQNPHYQGENVASLAG